MSYRLNSIRGTVISRWVKAGRPEWDLRQTIREVIEAVRAGKGPRAVKLRQNLNNPRYVELWVLGCHFPWLT